MRRALFILLVGSVCAFAQPPSLASRQQLAEQKTAEWDALAKTLESRLARMLPCDPRVRMAIEDVSKASDARLGALSQYWQSVAAQAHADVQSVTDALARQDLAARDIDVTRAEAEQQRIAVEAQVADLAESLKRRPQLADAQKSLAAIADQIRSRAATADQESGKSAALVAALRDLQAACVAREKSVQTEIAALTVETARWGNYYAARIARAHTECSITNQAPSRPLRKKQ